MAKETKLKKNIMMKIKDFTPPKYFVGDILFIKYLGLIMQSKVVDAIYDKNQKRWDYILQRYVWLGGEYRAVTFELTGSIEVITKISK